MRRASLNHTYRLVWNDRTNAFVAVAETTRARGKMSRAGRALLITLGVVAASAAGATNLPTGGQIVAGAGTISQSGNTLTITQNTAKLATDWQSFSIGQGSRVNFVQPSASAVALNRVLGSDPSVIQGALSANGQVFLLNPNGVLFTPTAQVNVGGLVASTLGMSNKDFLEGNYHLEGASSNAVINQGNITAANGGSIALIAARVINAGGLTATGGNVLLGAGNAVTLDLGGPVKLQVTQGAIDALVENGGAIRAHGGLVYLTTRAANALTSAVINNTGVIEAQTLATGEKGEIRLIADMQYGTLNAGGTLDSRAPNGGDGGFIETSAATVNTLPGLNVMAGAASGTGGTWLIDPYDYTINSTAASTIGTSLSGGTSVTVTTQSSNASYGATGAGTGDITVASAITKTGSGTATLTLQADHSIILNNNITATGGALNINLSAANGASATTGGVNINGNLDSNGGWIRIGGAGGSLTAAQSYGTGYALNLDSSNAAVLIGTSKSILSRGGDITINGRSNATTASYDGTKGGVYVKSGATVDSGGGSIYMSGVSTGDAKEFGFGVEANSGTVTTFKTSQTTGNIRIDAQNTIDPLGALGLVNNGNQARVQFIGPSVANLLFLINGSSKLATFTIHPPCGSSYPNCGTLVIPGGNESYTNAGYQVVNMSTVPLYIFTSSGTKEYDGTTAATGLTLSSLGGPVGFGTGDLGALGFVTASKNVGSYPSVSPTASNLLNYTSGGTTYAVGYFSNGSYSITPKPLSAVISNKVYDGNNTASVSASGVVGGDNLVFGYTAGTFAGTSVGTWSVNVSGITLGGTDAGNYSLSGSTSLTGTASITQRPVTLTGSRTYDATNTVASGIFTLDNVVSGEDLALSGSGTVADKNVATGKAVTLGTLALGDGSNGTASNYSLASGTADITKAALTVSGLTANNKTYDATTAATLTGTATLNGVLLTDSVSVSGTATGTFNTKNVGTAKPVTANLGGLSLGSTDAGNYEITGVTSPLTADITKAALTISGLSANSKTYDTTTAATLTGTASLSGVLGSDAVSLGGSATTGSFDTKNVGTGKAVTANLGGLSLGSTDAGNYEITGVTSPLTAAITKAALTISGLSANSKTYDATSAATLTGTASLDGVLGSDAVNLSGSATTGSFDTKNVGTGKAVTANLNGLSLGSTDAGNYEITGVTSPLIADITKAALTISGLAANSKTYDATTAATLTGTAALHGVLGSDVVSLGGSATTGSFDTKNVGTGKAVTANLGGLSLGSTDAGNYEITGVTSPLIADITKAALTISGLSANNKTYDATTAATLTGTAALHGVLGSDAVSLGGSATTGSFDTKNVGTGKAVTANLGGLSLGSTDAGNYEITGVTAPLAADITKAALTISGLAANSKTYDATTAATLTGTAALHGVLGSDVVSLGGSATTGSFDTKNVGTGKAVTANLGGLSLGSTDAGNYEITGVTSPLTANITKAVLTISGLAANNKTYDATTAATLSGTASLDGVLGSDVVSLGGSATTGTFDTKNVGTGKAVTANLGGLSLGSTDAGNYEITGVTAPLAANITPAQLTLTAAATSRSYGADNPAFTGTVSGFVGGETLASATTGGLAFSTAANAASNAGGHGISGGGLTATNGNYVFVQAPGNGTALTITPAPLSVTANNASKDDNGVPYAGGNGVVFSGFVNGESATVLGGTLGYGGNSQGATSAGSYAITPQGLTAGNYAISFRDGVLTINNSLPSDPQKYLPKPVQVQQFLTNTAALPAGTPPVATPDSLNYVAVGNGPTGQGTPALGSNAVPPGTPNTVNYVSVATTTGGQSGNGTTASAGEAPRDNRSGGTSNGRAADDINVNNFSGGTFKPTDIFVINGGVNTNGLSSLQ